MTQRTGKLRRHYPKLSVFERIQLVLAAHQRGDLSDIYALDRTCPGADLLPYLARLLALEQAACLLVIQLLAHAVLLATRFQPLADDTSPAAGPKPHLDSLFQRQAAIWHGFAAWCQDMGHDPCQVLLMAPLGLDHDDPAHVIIHQQIECFGTSREKGGTLCAPEEVHLWHDLFTQSFGHADT